MHIMPQINEALLQTALVALLFVIRDAYARPKVYNNYNVHVSKVYSGSGVVSEIPTRSIVECIIHCANDKDCHSISWRKDTPETWFACRLQRSYAHPEELVYNAEGGYAGMSEEGDMLVYMRR